MEAPTGVQVTVAEPSAPAALTADGTPGSAPPGSCAVGVSERIAEPAEQARAMRVVMFIVAMAMRVRAMLMLMRIIAMGRVVVSVIGVSLISRV